MILTITLNPLLEKRFIYNKIQPGGNNRSLQYLFTAGGKGINVSRQLGSLGLNTLAFTFLGGNNGKIFKNLLNEEKINFTNVQTKSETREAALIMEKDLPRLTTYFATNSSITKTEADEFKSKMVKMIENCEIVVFSGSSPCKETDDIFPAGIETANHLDKISICDTYGDHLQACIESAPTILHNNVIELKNSLNKDLSDEDETIELLNFLYSKNIKQSFITDGRNPVYANSFGFTYKAIPPSTTEIDATGSGDAFTAGIAYGLHKALTFNESLSLAINLGAANASKWEVCKTTIDEIDSINPVEINTIGKKIKSEL